MGSIRFIFMFLFFIVVSCNRQDRNSPTLDENPDINGSSSILVDSTNDSQLELSYQAGKGALLLTRFNSFEELKTVVDIEYFRQDSRKPLVRLKHQSGGREVISILNTGVSEGDFTLAQDGGFWTKVSLVLKSPYAIANRKDLQRVYDLARRRGAIFGEGDVAFYDLAETMMNNINDQDRVKMSPKDLSEKGYLNTFNHITAQAFMTSIFSERLADFVADSHERYHIPELITGVFTEDQLKDIENGPTDNYVDIINNEWGQELGNQLRMKYKISRKTKWTTELLENYLNDIQQYCSWAFQIGFEPFRASDTVVIRFSTKINIIMKNIWQ